MPLDGAVDDRPSRNSVTEAGKVLRRADEPFAVDEATFAAARATLQAWRRAHGGALHTARETLRSKVDSLGLPRDVSQRLKETRSVIEKLRAEPSMALGNMQDIAGCRAVVPTIDDAYALAESWQRLRVGEVRRVFDRIAEPQPSGYRAIHLQVVYDGLRVEVQIRTFIQNEWADLVEKLGPIVGHDLKRGFGPAPLLQTLAGLADTLYNIDLEGRSDAALAELHVVADRVLARVNQAITNGGES